MAGVLESGVVGRLLGLVVPPTCAACGAPRGAGRRPRLRAVPARAAVAARAALPALRAAASSARGCPAAGAAFAGAWAPLAYEGSARALVAALKFRGALAVADLMAAQIAAHLPPALRGARRGRRSCRSRRIRFAAGAAASTRRPSSRARSPRARGCRSPRCLRRRDRAPRQVGLGRAQRRRAGRLIIEATRRAARAGAADRRRPHDGRDARRVRAGAGRRGLWGGGGGDLRADAVNGGHRGIGVRGDRVGTFHRVAVVA